MALTADAESVWTPNQRAARQRIIEAAANLIGREGLRACTLRAVAEESGLKKSTVHYYFDDANELVDLSVTELLERLARSASESLDDIPDAPGSLSFLVRLFMGRGDPPPFRDGALWPEYSAHALKRDAHAQLDRGLETVRVVFEAALRKADFGEEEARARSASVHDYLLGAMVRNMVQPIERAELAKTVSAISGVELDPTDC